MNSKTKTLTVEVIVKAAINKVWLYFTQPEHIIHWNHASIDWHCPKASNVLKLGEKFSYTMASKDGSMSFDFNGTYTDLFTHERICYTLEDGRKVEVHFRAEGETTVVKEIFEPEQENTLELQQTGWQSILTNFKNYTEEN